MHWKVNSSHILEKIAVSLEKYSRTAAKIYHRETWIMNPTVQTKVPEIDTMSDEVHLPYHYSCHATQINVENMMG